MFKYTEQQAFDEIATHLLTQKKKSLLAKDHPAYGSNLCAYKSDDGSRCAIGALLTDREIDFIGEGEYGGRIRELTRFSDLSDEFINRVQTIHDDVKPSRWIEKLSSLATERGLDKSVLKPFRKPRRKTVAAP